MRTNACNDNKSCEWLLAVKLTIQSNLTSPRNPDQTLALSVPLQFLDRR